MSMGCPPAVGLALGIDRLVMLLTSEPAREGGCFSINLPTLALIPTDRGLLLASPNNIVHASQEKNILLSNRQLSAAWISKEVHTQYADCNFVVITASNADKLFS